MSEWQDISTAPKVFGQFVLVVEDEWYDVCHWVDNGIYYGFPKSGWYCREDYEPSCEPTHWMPLPDPPKRASAAPPVTTETADADAAGDAAHSE